MTDYDALVKALRLDVKLHKAEDALLNASAAADAIEELQLTVEHYKGCADDWYKEACDYKAMMPRWIPETERLPSDFVSVQAHMTDAGQFPSVREAYVVNGHWFFPALKEFHPVDKWMDFSTPPKEDINHVG